jgi:hypothetical protein
LQQLLRVVVEELVEEASCGGRLGPVSAFGLELVVLVVEEPRLQALLASAWVFCCPRRHRFRSHVRRLVQLMSDRHIGTPPGYYESFGDAFLLFEQLLDFIPSIRRVNFFTLNWTEKFMILNVCLQLFPYDVEILAESEQFFDENLLQTKEDFYWQFINLMWKHEDVPQMPIVSTSFLSPYALKITPKVCAIFDLSDVYHDYPFAVWSRGVYRVHFALGTKGGYP